MTTDLDLNIYKAIEQEKKITEIYLGYKEFEWYFSKAKYSATCTEAIDFTLFDKTICGLLKIEDHLSLEEIGEILGFNVIDNPNEKKYKDLAEYEILKEALQSLEEFGMIDGGDIYYSYCTLTPTGKEYVEKGKKFKIHENKNFELFFDNVNNDHANAKNNFEYLKGEKIIENNTNFIDYEDEAFLKTFAEHQIPDIYNPEKMHSFTDITLHKVTYHKTTMYAVFLLDINSGKHRTIVYEDTNKKINEYFTEYIKNNIEFDNKLFNSFLINNYKLVREATIPDNYIEKLNYYQEKIEIAIQENQVFTHILEDYYNKIEFIEPTLFYLKLYQFIKSANSEIWLSISKVNTTVINNLEYILNSIKQQDLYLFIKIFDDENYEDQIDKLISIAEESKNIFVLADDNISQFECYIDQPDKFTKFHYHETFLPAEVNESNVFINCPMIKRSPLKDNRQIIEMRKYFADNFFPVLYKEIANDLIDFDYSNKNDKNLFNEIATIDKKISAFKTLPEYSAQISELQELKKVIIDKIKEQRKKKITENIEKLINKIQNIEQPDKRFIEKIKNETKQEKEKCFEFELDLFNQLEKEIIILEKELELINSRKSIIIDTNILIEEPNIINIIGPGQTIVFSGKVIDELDKLKTKPELKEKAQLAIRNIKRNQQNKNIKFNFGKMDLLPDDFDKKSPDNMILSVAIQYKKYNPVLLTNDNGMSIKAKMLEIPAKNIEELKVLLKPKKQSNKKNKRRNKSKKRK